MLRIHADDFSPFPFAEEIASLIDAKAPAILLVPEQLALATERALAARYPASAPLYFEVSNFSRLADRVFRTEGGISEAYTDPAADIILMWKTLDALSPFLITPKLGATDTVKESLSLLAEVTASGVSPTALREAARRLPPDRPLKAKLSDLALLTETFTGERDAVYGSLSRDLDRLCGILKEKPVLADTAIFVSGFTSFTAGEAAVLAEIMRRGHLAVSLPLPDAKESSLAYEEVLATRTLLLSLADRVGASVTQTEVHPPRAPMLAYAKERLFRTDGDSTPYAGAYDGTLTFALTKDAYTAATQIAAKIAADVRRGARYRDFAVITRAPDKYDGILDVALEAEGIPLFYAKETSMTDFALAKMILAAYACLDRGFARADTVAYMKCGFSGVLGEDADLFELYAETWRLKGSAFSSDIPFTGHPEGYKAKMSASAEATLARINEARVTLLSPLWALAHATEGKPTAREHATALFHFLTTLAAEKTLLASAACEQKRGRHTEAARLLRLFPILVQTLDRIVTIMGDCPLTRARFAELLSLLFSAIPVYTIPTLMDAVTVADADTFRPTGEKHLFLFGAIEGEFPGAVSLGGVFPEEERSELAALGITVGKPPEVKASREQFSFLRGLAATPSATVLAFSSDALGTSLRPSAAFHRLLTLFPHTEIKTEAGEIYSLSAAKERLYDMVGTPLEAALLPLIVQTEVGERLAAQREIPLFDPVCSVSAETAEAFFPDDMVTSQSALDRFLDCPFSYFCKYALGLKENETAAIRPVEVGNIVHEILERFFALLQEEGTSIRDLLPERIPLYVTRAVEEYADKLLHGKSMATARLSHLFYRLRRAAILVCEDLYEEFLASAFNPTFFELSLEGKEGPGRLTFRDEDGKTVSFGGRIDRVDTYRTEEGKLYVRVVDYKSSAHTFSREELKNGRNLQMFVYLCAIWKTESERFLSRLSVSDSENLLPAGIVYNTVNPKSPAIDTPRAKTDVKQMIAKEHLKRKGFFLADEAILRAMDDRLPHMPYSRDKMGGYKTDGKLFGTLDDFNNMLKETEDAVLKTARRMRSGCADIDPDKESNRCPDCPYRTVCRIENVKAKSF